MVANEQNPFRSPDNEDFAASKKSSPAERSPWVASIFLWVIGFAFLNLLNGREFNNHLVFLICVAGSAIFWWKCFVAIRREKGSASLVPLLLHVFFLVAVSIGLPNALQRQQSWQDVLERVQTDRHDSTRNSVRNNQR